MRPRGALALFKPLLVYCPVTHCHSLCDRCFVVGPQVKPCCITLCTRGHSSSQVPAWRGLWTPRPDPRIQLFRLKAPPRKTLRAGEHEQYHCRRGARLPMNAEWGLRRVGPVELKGFGLGLAGALLAGSGQGRKMGRCQHAISAAGRHGEVIGKVIGGGSRFHAHPPAHATCVLSNDFYAPLIT